MASSSDYAIPCIRALKRPERAKEAQELLEKIAEQVLPIMTMYKWKVKRLTEFSPKDPCLLGINVNRGATISIRLRPANRPNSFYPYTELLGTMLHELVHMRHGPHNDVFYQLLEVLKRKTEALMASALTGNTAVAFGTAGAGQALGGRFVSDPRSGRRLPLQVIEGHRLGGGMQNGQDPRELRAAAAERRRRLQDDKACTAIYQGRNVNSGEIIEISDDEEDLDEGSLWSCSECTLLNPRRLKKCQCCGSNFVEEIIDLT